MEWSILAMIDKPQTFGFEMQKREREREREADRKNIALISNTSYLIDKIVLLKEHL